LGLALYPYADSIFPFILLFCQRPGAERSCVFLL